MEECGHGLRGVFWEADDHHRRLEEPLIPEQTDARVVMRAKKKPGFRDAAAEEELWYQPNCHLSIIFASLGAIEGWK